MTVGPIIDAEGREGRLVEDDEAVWFDTFYRANVIPLFFVEALADLEKEVAGGRTPEDVVGNLAFKTPVCDADGQPRAVAGCGLFEFGNEQKSR